MNILFLTDNFPPEGNAIATRVYERACYWKKWGHEVTIITSVPNFPEGKIHTGYQNRWYQVESIQGIKVVRVKTFISANRKVFFRIIDFMSFMFTSFVAGVYQKKPDVIIATSPQFFTAVSGWMVSTLKRKPFIFELADLWPASITAVGVMNDSFIIKAIEKLELFLYRKAAAVIALTNAFKEDLKKRGIDENKITVVINGVDLARYSPRPKDNKLLDELGIKDKFIIGYIGTMGMAHALEQVLEAAELLINQEDICFLFVGDGEARERLVEIIRERGLRNVILHPAQPKEKMPAFLSLLDIALVHLKNNHVFATVIPSKMFESMGMGLPILLVGPEGGEASKILLENRAGLSIPPEDPSIFAQTVLNLKNDHVLLSSLAKASREAASYYTREKQARGVIEVCNGVLKKG